MHLRAPHFPTDHIVDPSLRLRAEWATALCYAIRACHADDAMTIMTAALESALTEGPQTVTFGPVKADAEWWAEIAPPYEVQAYVWAGLTELQGKAIGPKARLRLIIALWNGMPADDKARFLKSAQKAVDG